MKPKREAFTLIELLVVVAIIATLSALLIPVISKAMAGARKSNCQSNLGQWATGLSVYAAENKGEVFSSTSGNWPLTLQPYMGDTPVSKEGEIEPQAITFCPAARGALSGPNHGWGIFGSRTRMYRIWNHHGSYGFNASLRKPTGTGNAFYYRALADASSRTPAFLDSCWIDGGTALETSPPRWDKNPTLDGHGYAGGIDRFAIARHDLGVNISFADGHCEWTPITHLWTLQWNPIFKPMDVQPIPPDILQSASQTN